MNSGRARTRSGKRPILHLALGLTEVAPQKVYTQVRKVYKQVQVQAQHSPHAQKHHVTTPLFLRKADVHRRAVVFGEFL